MIPPVAAAKVVFMATCAAKAPSLALFIVNVEPGLKPYQPNQRAKVPSLRGEFGSAKQHIASLKIDGRSNLSTPEATYWVRGVNGRPADQDLLKLAH